MKKRLHRPPRLDFLVGLTLIVLFASLAACGDGFELTGTVKDLDDTPLAGVEVWVNQDRQPQKTVTGEEGAFAFSGLGVGIVQLVARKEGYAFGGQDVLMVGSGTAHVVLGSPDTLEVRVVDRGGVPIAGANLRRMFIGGLFHVEVEDLANLGFPSYRSDDGGWLRIDQMPTGGYLRFTVGHRKFADYTMPYFAYDRKLDISLGPGFTLRGRITGPKGEGLHNARVAVFRTIAVVNHAFADILTGPDGFYRVRVPKGDFFVAARREDYASPPPKRVVVRDAEKATVANFALLSPHRIRGQVVGLSGKPMGGVRVAYMREGREYGATWTTADGAYALVAPSGEGALHVVPPDGFMREAVIDTRVVIGEEEEVKAPPLRLLALPKISGKVTGKDGQPLANALIWSLNLTHPIWLMTDAQGNFNFRLDRMPEESPVKMRAEHPLRFLRQDFAIDLNKAGDIEVALTKSYVPDLHPCDKGAVPNDMANMRGKEAPEIACDKWFNTEALTLKELRGKVVVLTLWGGFDTAGPDMERIWEICALHDILHEVEDIFFLAVHDASKEPEEVKQYVEDYEIPFAVGCDADPFLTFDIYNTNTIPQTVLIDKKGILRYYDVNGRILELIKALRRE